MGILKELNEIAAKLTGENPKKKTTSQALDYIEKNITNRGGGSSSNVYETTYDATSETFGTIPTNLTIDDFANSVIKVSYTFEYEGVSHHTRVMQVISALSRDDTDELYLIIFDIREDQIGEIEYVPSTGQITYSN